MSHIPSEIFDRFEVQARSFSVLNQAIRALLARNRGLATCEV
jgi:hypothetical protein